MAAMQARAVAAVRALGRAARGRARRRRGLGGGQPRRRDQGGPRRRARHAPRPLPADRRRPGVGRVVRYTAAAARSCCAANDLGGDLGLPGAAGRRRRRGAGVVATRPSAAAPGRGAAAADRIGSIACLASSTLRPARALRRRHRRRARAAHVLPAGPRRRPGRPASRWRSSRCGARRADRRAARRGHAPVGRRGRRPRGRAGRRSTTPTRWSSRSRRSSGPAR